MSYPGHLLEEPESYPSAEMQPVYSTAFSQPSGQYILLFQDNKMMNLFSIKNVFSYMIVNFIPTLWWWLPVAKHIEFQTSFLFLSQ